MNAAAANLLSHPRAAGETVPKLRRSPEEVAAAVMQDLSLRLCDAQEKLTKEELLLQKGPTPTKQLKVDAAKAKVDAIQQKLGAAQQKYIAARLKSVAKEEADTVDAEAQEMCLAACHEARRIAVDELLRRLGRLHESDSEIVCLAKRGRWHGPNEL